MKIIIAGAYAIGTHLARLLSREHDDIVVIEPNEERLAGIGQDVDILTSTTDLRCRGLGSVGTYTTEPLLCWA